MYTITYMKQLLIFVYVFVQIESYYFRLKMLYLRCIIMWCVEVLLRCLVIYLLSYVNVKRPYYTIECNTVYYNIITVMTCHFRMLLFWNCSQPLYSTKLTSRHMIRLYTNFKQMLLIPNKKFNMRIV